MALWTNTVMAANLGRDEFMYPSNSDNSDFEETFRTIPDDTSEIFDPPPSVSTGLELETEIVNENENNPNSDEPNLYELQETPIYNYSGDAEIEQDFHDGWYWVYLPNEEDTGPEYGPFLGKQQLLLYPQIKEPKYFFYEMFSISMFDMITKSMNRYVTQKLQWRGRSFFLFYSFFPSKEIQHKT